MTPVEVGLLCGTLWAATLVAWALADQVGEEPHPWLVVIQELYAGFDATWRGIAIGALWAFGDGFLSGYGLATLWMWIRG